MIAKDEINVPIALSAFRDNPGDPFHIIQRTVPQPPPGDRLFTRMATLVQPATINP